MERLLFVTKKIGKVMECGKLGKTPFFFGHVILITKPPLVLESTWDFFLLLLQSHVLSSHLSRKSSPSSLARIAFSRLQILFL